MGTRSNVCGPIRLLVRSVVALVVMVVVVVVVAVLVSFVFLSSPHSLAARVFPVELAQSLSDRWDVLERTRRRRKGRDLWHWRVVVVRHGPPFEG